MALSFMQKVHKYGKEAMMTDELLWVLSMQTPMAHDFVHIFLLQFDIIPPNLGSTTVIKPQPLIAAYEKFVQSYLPGIKLTPLNKTRVGKKLVECGLRRLGTTRRRVYTINKYHTLPKEFLKW